MPFLMLALSSIFPQAEKDKTWGTRSHWIIEAPLLHRSNPSTLITHSPRAFTSQFSAQDQ